MPDNIRQIFESHHCFCESSPYYIVSEETPSGGAVSDRGVRAGFDLDVYGVKWSREPDPAAEFWLVYTRLEEIADAVRRAGKNACSIDLIPFGSNIVLDTRNHLHPMAMLRIRITHKCDVHQCAGVAEQDALKAVEAELEALGVRIGRS